MQAFLASYVVRYVLTENPDAVGIVQCTLPGYTRVWLEAQQRALTWLAADWAKLLKSYYQPDNFLEKSKQSRLQGAFIVKFRSTYNMPKKQAPTTFERAEWKGFLERKLSDAELADFDSQQVKPEEILVSMEKLASEGYQFKLSYSDKLKAYTATLVDQNQRHKTAGYALSAADDSGLGALSMLLYKFLVVLDGNLESLLTAERPARRG